MSDPYRQPDPPPPCDCGSLDCAECLERLAQWLPRFDIPNPPASSIEEVKEGPCPIS